MKAVILEAFGKLELRDLPTPKPGPGQVLVRIRAASLNYRDLLMVKGGYGSVAKPPFVPVSDGAGEVAEVGPGVTRVKPGDRVTMSFFQKWLAGPAHRLDPRAMSDKAPLGGPNDGTLREFGVFDENGVSVIPDHLSHEEAACLPCAGLTAWSAVVAQATTEPGDVVLTQGSGGVSIFALQFAKLRGCRVIATSSSDEKIARLKALGADVGINYKTTPEWGKAARAANGGQGVDQVVEVGGAGTLAQSIRATRFGGTLSMIGVLDGAAGDVPVALIVMSNLRLQGVTVGNRADLDQMIRAIDAAKLKPVVDSVFPLAKWADAMAHMSAGRHFGKVCIGIG
ncbi:NAD(P)-dependent alcohol dehydrogenase [Vineibacter terrae]|uniref:zinc-dependent alcohol dehydrogenase family protein n=1 Tax=Vineibacter terrae TaxID=2586908 RepID=UPI002E2F01BA|nr:NAD(P)-dependent alcohol dehydrogenase [Vineibacter terrae]HEX2886174.1 NAD(P)-dependent alcohol dehydrogenase [Vineibacter terrae]